jgi:hypothetical protein
MSVYLMTKQAGAVLIAAPPLFSVHDSKNTLFTLFAVTFDMKMIVEGRIKMNPHTKL